MTKVTKRDCTIYLVRHGETKWNVRGRLQGHTDAPLTRKGKRQARKLGRLLKDIHFDAVYSSDLLRAKRTAQIATLEKKLAVKTSQALRERRFGKHEGKTVHAFREEFKHMYAKYDNELTEEERRPFNFDGEIESDEKLISRFITFLREIAVAHSGQTVLVVSHGGTIRAFLIGIGFAKAGELPFGTIGNACRIKLISDGVDFFVKETTGIMIRQGN